jgi:hypothetical protein
MTPKLWSRRAAMRMMAFAGITPLLHGEDAPWIALADYQKRLETFYNETDTRPEFVWVNREDVMYHDHDYPPSIAGAPEYCAFIKKRWVFNRTMQWIRDEGAILCYENAGIVNLSGENQASAWHTGPDNTLKSEGDFSIWTKHSQRRRDCVILPAFQFHVTQHPIVELEADGGDSEWQFCVALKGRGGPPLIATPWHLGHVSARIDLFAELARRGFDWNFPELHFVIGSWGPDPNKTSEIRFRARMLPRACVVGSLPVIRTAARGRSEGVPILAIAVDSDGRGFNPKDVRLSVSAGDYTAPMEHSGNVWIARLRDLKTGEHMAIINAEGALRDRAYVHVRVTDGRFYSMPRQQHWPIWDGKVTGPLTGSYQGTFFFRDAGTEDERMVQTQEDWNSWDRSRPDAEHMHYWESLTLRELDERFRYLATSGFDLLALHSHWGVWERLDAGGQIAPHAAEQLARYLRTAGLHGLAHIQALSSGPYMSPGEEPSYGGTIPYSRYLDEGFQTSEFMKLENTRFDQLFHQYLRDFATLFSDETAIFAMTGSGEGDEFSGPARANDTMSVIQSIDRNHIFLAETIDVMRKLPQRQCEGFRQDRFGGRTYSAGNNAPAEYEIGVYFKFLQMANMYMAEGSWATMPQYNRFHYEVTRDFRGSPRCWTGTQQYRIRLRDTFWLGLVHLLPVMNSWDEAISEDEHFLLRHIRGQVDWNQPFAPPGVALQVDDECANQDSAARKNVTRYEEALVHLGLMYRFIEVDERKTWDALAVIDARQPFRSLRFESEGGSLPDKLKQEIPLDVGPGYACSYAWSQDRHTLLAYVYNTTNHQSDYMWLCGEYHRAPKTASLQLQVKNLPASNLRAQLYDLNTKQLLSSATLNDGKGLFDQGPTKHDFFLLVTPIVAEQPGHGL